MPHLWITQNDRWFPLALSAPALALSPEGTRPLERFDPAPAWLREVCGDWVLLASRGSVAVNGSPLRGLRVLRDRDELRFDGGARVYFSTEQLAAVRPHESDATLCCPRCKLASITRGVPTVTCPTCKAVCHQAEDLACWTYGPTCPLCDQPTALDAGYHWSPEDLD
ncbi:MAG: hypothetical protein ABMA13_02300 [Chthoniobacteraceae bacterium]